MGVQETDLLSELNLPPGFRFYPTDEELLVQYLCKKVAGHQFNLQIIGDIDLYKFDPWVLPSKAIFGEKEWYFFSPRDRKYPNGSRPNRVAGSGYWKATGTDKIITTQGTKIGIKKALVFYVGKAPSGTKTNWIMHEYRLSDPPRKNDSSKLDDWVLCRIYKKNSSGCGKPGSGVQSKEISHGGSSSSSSSQLDDVLEPLPEIGGRFLKTVHQDDQKNSIQNLGSVCFDWTAFAGVDCSLPELGPGNQARAIPAAADGHVNSNSSSNNGNVNAQQNELYGPSFPQVCHVDEEVQSGHDMTQNRVENSGFFQPSTTNGFAPQSFHNSVGPFGTWYPTQNGNMGWLRP